MKLDPTLSKEEYSWMAYSMAQLSMAMAYGIPFDRKEIIGGASLITDWMNKSYEEKEKQEALQFLDSMHQKITDWFEEHKNEREGYSDTHPTINPVTDQFDLLSLLYTALDALVEHGDQTTEPWIRKQLGVSR
jgi:hypothetical protein